MRDEFPNLRKPWKKECGIFNFHTSNEPGIHWVAWKKVGNKKYYFDSYGLRPPKELVDYLGKEHLYYVTDRHQDFDSEPNCGYLCLDFIENHENYIK